MRIARIPIVSGIAPAAYTNPGKLNRRHPVQRTGHFNRRKTLASSTVFPRHLGMAELWDAPESFNHTDATSRAKESSWMCTASKRANIPIDHGSNSERLVNAESERDDIGACDAVPRRLSD